MRYRQPRYSVLLEEARVWYVRLDNAEKYGTAYTLEFENEAYHEWLARSPDHTRAALQITVEASESEDLAAVLREKRWRERLKRRGAGA
jgi:hypothetical protein